MVEKFWAAVVIVGIILLIAWLKGDGAWLAELIFDQKADNVPVPQVPGFGK